MVDRAVRDSLDKREVKRQGLWWELINGEREYVRDLKVVCEVGRTCHQTLIVLRLTQARILSFH